MRHRYWHHANVSSGLIRAARFYAVWIAAAAVLGSFPGTSARAASCTGAACGSVKLLTDTACPGLRNVAERPITVEIVVHNTVAGSRKERFELKPGQSRPARALGECAKISGGGFSYQADFLPPPKVDPASPCLGNACGEVALFLRNGCVHARNKGDGYVEMVPLFGRLNPPGSRALTLGPYKQMPVGSPTACLKIDMSELSSQRYSASFVLPPDLRPPGKPKQEIVKARCDGNACRDLAYRMVEQHESAAGIDVRCVVATNKGSRWIALTSRISAPGGTQASGQSETMVGPGKEVLPQAIGAGSPLCAQEGDWLSVTANYGSSPSTQKSITVQLGEPLVRITGKCSGTACDHVGLVLGPKDKCAWVENRGGVAVRFETKSAEAQVTFVTTIGPGDFKKIARPTCVQGDARSLGAFPYTANYKLPESKWRLGDASGRDFRVQGNCGGGACQDVFLVMRQGEQCAMVENKGDRPVSFTTSYIYGYFSGTVPPGQTVLIRAKTPRGPNGCISGDEAMLRARKYEAGYIRPPNTLTNPAWHLGEPLQREKGQCEGTACAQVEILKGPNDDCVHVQNIGKTPVRVSVTRYGQFDSELRGFDVLIPPGHLRKMPAPGGCYLATGGRPVPPKLGNTRYIANYPLPEAKTGGPRPAPPFYFPGR
jgi:hypothetical protein